MRIRKFVSSISLGSDNKKEQKKEIVNCRFQICLVFLLGESKYSWFKGTKCKAKMHDENRIEFVMQVLLSTIIISKEYL